MGCGRVNYGSGNPQIYTTGAYIYIRRMWQYLYKKVEYGIREENMKNRNRRWGRGLKRNYVLYRVGEKEEESEKFDR